jgi:glyoxylase-like metal-dependent hydrolase (beta-lactamase superfamily II)
MEILHLNCGTMYPYGLPSDDDTGGFLKRGYGVIHCLLVDTGDGLVLVDTGWGQRDCSSPSAAVRQFMDIIGCPGDLGETAARQIETLGYAPGDVKHIFLTHLHMDHAGGLADFPAATVHVYDRELEAYRHPRTLVEWRAYRPEHCAHDPKWQVHGSADALWFGLSSTPSIRIGEIEFVMIPFIGHTRGHCGVAVRMGGRWLLHCGDAYGYYRQVGSVQPYRHPCGKLMEAVVMTGFRIPRQHLECIRKLLREHGDQVQTFCSHDSHEFEGYKDRVNAH